MKGGARVEIKHLHIAVRTQKEMVLDLVKERELRSSSGAEETTKSRSTLVVVPHS